MMEYPPAKRQRNTKFDTRHRHRHHAKDANDGEVEPQASSDAQVEATAPGFVVENHLRAQDTLAGEVKHGQVQGHLQRRQGVTVDVAVTLDSTAVVSIGVDADGTPTTTGTTTLAADSSSSPADSTSSPSDVQSTPDTSASAATSPSISAGASSTSSSSTASTATSGGVTSASLTAEPATSPSTTSPASTTSSSASVTDSNETALTTSPVGISGYGFVTTGTSEAASSSILSADTSSLFPSLTATNGTTTSGVSFSSSGSDTVTAAGVTSTAASFSGSESAATNATIAGVHTTHHTDSTSITKSQHSSSVQSTSSGFRSSTSTSRYSSWSSSSTTATSSTETYAGFGGASSATSGAPSATSSSSTNGTVSTHNDDTSVAPPATIAGSVVGSVAGVALLGVIIFYLLRMYHKKRSLAAEQSNSARQLGVEDPFGDPAPGGAGAMTQHSSAAFFSAAAAGLFGRMSRHSEPEVPAEERGFRKVSGRKLPSAFSPGMEALPAGAASASRSGPTDKEMGLHKESATSPTNPDNPFDSPTNSDHTARDTGDWYSRGNDSFATTAVPPGTASTGLTHFVPGAAGAEFGRERYPSSTYSVDTSGVPRPYSPPQPTRLTETLLPSPARTPVIQQPSPFGRVSHVPGIGHGEGPSIESRAGSPTSPTRQPSGRGYSLDGSRGSRFAEDIP